MSLPSAARAGTEPGPQGIEAVRSEFRRSRGTLARGRSGGRREFERLPRVALDDALAILLDWRRDPLRFDRGAVAWHARLAGYAPRLTLADSEEAVSALRGLAGPSAGAAALRLADVLMRHDLHDAATVLDTWLASRSAPTK